MSRLITTLLTLVLALGGAATVSGDTIPSAPTNLTQVSLGNSIPAGGWINQRSITLRFQVVSTGSQLTPQVELRPTNKLFSGQPTSQGKPATLPSGQTQTVSMTVSSLQPKTRYNWQVRVVDAQGSASSWVIFPPQVGPVGRSAFAVDTVPPTQPRITSSTNPQSGWWYRTRVERFSWRSADADSGVARYSYRVDQRTDGTPGKLSTQTTLALRNLKDGRWVLHVWARDGAGNWSRQTIYKFNLDTAPPAIRFIGNSTHVFNPYVGKQTWRYSISEWARVVIHIRRSGQPGPVLTRDLGKLSPGAHAYTWDGRTSSKKLAGADWHWFHVFATDGLGNHSNRAFGGIHVQPVRPIVKRIVVSLTQQTISAYQNGRLVWSSLATTGNFRLSPTPAGHYAIFVKYSPFQFISPWPPGDPLWYAPAWSTYAMEFISGGYFIHDAPWRSVFGPASQGGGGPGTNYGGTHGCVNVPVATAKFLWQWAPVGTTVDVIGSKGISASKAPGLAGP